MTTTTIEACQAEGESWLAAEPDTPAGTYCTADAPCAKHKREWEKRAKRLLAAEEKRKQKEAERAAKRGHGVFEADGRLCLGDEIVVDGVIAVDHVIRSPRGTVYRMRVQRPDDAEVIHADMKPDTMEQAALWNAWLSRVASVNGRIGRDSRQALKDYLWRQVQAMQPAVQVSNAGYVEAFDVLALEGGWIDATGVLRRTVDATRGVELVVGGPGNGKGSVRSLYLQTQDLGLDVPSVPARVPTELMDPALVPVDRSLYHYPNARGALMSEARSTLRRFYDLAVVNYGNAAVPIVMGYLFAHAVSPHLYRTFDRFPHLYIYGGAQTGKDFLARVCMTVALGGRAAITAAGKGGTTPKLVRNGLGQNSLLPMWFNEIRELKQDDWIDTFIRASYDRQGSATTNIEQERVDFPVRRSMLLVGEAIAGGGAEFTRYVELETRPVAAPEMRAELEAMVPAAREAWLTLLCDWHRAAPAVLDMVKVCKDQLQRQAGVDERRALAWACVVSGLAWTLEPRAGDPADAIPESWWDEIMDRLGRAMTRSNSNGAFAKFWEIAADARRRDMLGQQVGDRWVWTQELDGEPVVALDFLQLITRTEQATRSRIPDSSLVRNELVRFTAFRRQLDMAVTHGGKKRFRRGVMVFDAKHPALENCFPGWAIEMAYHNELGLVDEVLFKSHEGARAAARKENT